MQFFFSLPHAPNLEPRVFSCKVYDVHILKVLETKYDNYTKRCVFIGYSDFQKGYRCYDPHSKKLHVTLDMSFQESEPYDSREFLLLPFRGRAPVMQMRQIF
ncbi:hypothetical protein ACH5RR_039008 [Cinchona calisaya]|uniref:Retroviral polymerase SH3-like domain-containing protein n=1 Tax=Cinchona calisaya TaxID=153742 RepID=A0ABD2Y2A4_9GENT